MKAWLYYRLSRDEDEEMNSLQNQRQILVDYAEQNGYECDHAKGGRANYNFIYHSAVAICWVGSVTVDSMTGAVSEGGT